MTFQTLEKNGGRIEKQVCRAASVVEWLMDLPLWAGLKTIFSVTRTTTIKDKTTEETGYYISSLECNLENLIAASQSQWKVESMHWMLRKTMHSNGWKKDILGVWIGENESSKFWLSVLNDLRNRGVNDVYVFCVDGLTGFREAIWAVYLKSQIQRCIIHQIRSSTRYVNYKDIKPLMADLKPVYQAVNEDEGIAALIRFTEKWGKTYPSCVKSWNENNECEHSMDIFSTFFAISSVSFRVARG